VVEQVRMLRPASTQSILQPVQSHPETSSRSCHEASIPATTQCLGKESLIRGTSNSRRINDMVLVRLRSDEIQYQAKVPPRVLQATHYISNSGPSFHCKLNIRPQTTYCLKIRASSPKTQIIEHPRRKNLGGAQWLCDYSLNEIVSDT
jgi:hypothetical protein